MIMEANLTWRYIDTECNLIMPWYTLPALQWLKSFSVNTFSVFEYGCGYSTIWFRLNCNKVISVDSNAEWSLAMGAIHAIDKEEYIKSIRNEWDIVVVDGEYREECVAHAVDFVKPSRFLIIDNYESENYNPSSNEELLKDWPKQIFKQPNHSTWTTAIFMKP